MADCFDYIIVGGGSAGSLLARRLVDAGHSVCVLEAGPRDTSPFIHIPAGFIKTFTDPKITWPYKTDPTYWTAGRQVAATQGRTLGGSSSINGMVFIRGHPADYDMWAQRGNAGWGYQDVLPYFRRLERRIGPADTDYRGRNGELPITDPTWTHALCDAFIESAQSQGFTRNLDYNGPNPEGTGYYQRAIAGERRVSAARAYLHPVSGNQLLDVRTNAQATTILFDGKRATGVKYVYGSRSHSEVELRARREIVVSAGAIGSPKLLLLSGIGDSTQLKSLGIPLVAHLTGVGENLSDHYSPRIVARAKNIRTINEIVRGPRLLGEVVKFALGQPSVLGLSAAHCFAFGRSEPDIEADYTLIFTPASYRAGVLGKLDKLPGMTCGAWQMRPESTGHVRLTSGQWNEMPLVQPNYLERERDRHVLVSALRMARAILSSSPLSAYFDHEHFPGVGVQSDDELLDFARRHGSSCYHLSGTCRMGPETDKGAVVDSQLRVRGIEGLRVIDSSVIPAVPSTNTYASTLMIAEKAADIVLDKPALEQNQQSEAEPKMSRPT